VEEQEFLFAEAEQFDWLMLTAGVLIILCSQLIDELPWLCLILPLVAPAIPQITRWRLTRRAATHPSSNVICCTGGSESQPALYFCAHIDTAPTAAFEHRLARRIQSRIFDIYQRTSIALAIAGVLLVVGFSIPGWFVWILKIAGILVGGWIVISSVWSQISPQKGFSPGANDNVSGVGVLLALAKHYAQHPPDRIRLFFVFTDAEESGMHGARAFAQRLSNERSRILGVINVDMVGIGDVLRYVDRDGTLNPISTSIQLNELICRANPAARPINYTIKSGDFLPFLKAGIPAASIEVSGSTEAELVYHTSLDKIGLIQESALNLCNRTLQAVVSLLDEPTNFA
jgi:hypothetical protein